MPIREIVEKNRYFFDRLLEAWINQNGVQAKEECNLGIALNIKELLELVDSSKRNTAIECLRNNEIPEDDELRKQTIIFGIIALEEIEQRYSRA